MKYIMMVFSVAVLLLAGCAYEAPFTKEHSIAIDSTVLGLWEWEPKLNEGEDSKREVLMILKYSDTEYLILYPVGKDGIYFRGYPIQIAGISCVQLQTIGGVGGPPGKNETTLFHAASYQLTDGQLEIKTLNTDLVDDDLKTTGELRKAFLKHKDNKDLFKRPRVFRKKK
jgi:hypothetical protein